MLVKVLDWIIPLRRPKETSRGKMTRWGTLGLGHIEKNIVKLARKGEGDFGINACNSAWRLGALADLGGGGR